VIGGAEAVLSEMAHGLRARGLPVEILTTCARDHFTWANEFPVGVTELADGVRLRRFATEVDADTSVRDRLGHRILAGDDLSIQDQQLWVNSSLRCSGLWHHVFDHGHRYRALIFAPYMFWTTYAVSQIHTRRSILMPCLHNEPPAYLDIYRSMMEAAGGVWFLTDPEQELANRLYQLSDRQRVVGAAVGAPTDYRPGRFRERFGITGPYAYYAGRREWGKGWDDLVSAFAAYRGRRPRLDSADHRLPGVLTLVTSGVGAVDDDHGLGSGLVDVGLISDDDRNDAMAGAAVYLQPSAMESFSRTVLEAFAAGTPVVANGHSDVVRWHIERTGAGLTYRNQAELMACLDFVTDEPEAAQNLAGDGRDYVIEHYGLDAVVDAVAETVEAWMPPAVNERRADRKRVPSGAGRGRT
jgi:glycosyltransferase involved in cell wall biosynthesis